MKYVCLGNMKSA
uniref:Uncharacterized protein n=1 Tax=Nymphaea colorata TaxID=210225 RepID=A0A5K0VPZ9_9MAGN